MHVRGTCEVEDQGTYLFAGSFVVREGRDDLDHDLWLGKAAGGKMQVIDEPLPGIGGWFATLQDELAMVVNDALSQAGGIVEREMNRICG